VSTVATGIGLRHSAWEIGELTDLAHARRRPLDLDHELARRGITVP
jgi:hypothetical protein